MDKFFGAVIVIALIATALGLMFASWQRRRRRDIAIVTSGVSSAGTRLLEIECFYVSTTPTDEPLERLAIPGLAFRARATVGVSRDGIELEPRGEFSTVISRDHLVQVRPADATIDRSAGRGSLTAIDWIADNGLKLTSFLRIPSRLDRTLFVDTVNATFNSPNSAPKEHTS